MPSFGVYLSVCLSVYLSRSSTETSKRILKLFHHLIDRPTILVFPYQILWQYSDGKPHITAASNADFKVAPLFDVEYLRTIQDRDTVTME